MRVHDLVRRSLLPCAILALVLSVTTALAPMFADGAGYLDDVAEQLDLRNERNVATWFMSVVLLFCGMSFLSLLPLEEELGEGGRWRRRLLLLFALGCLLLSADETAMFHEKTGVLLEKSCGVTDNTEIEGRGFSWVLVVGPVLLLGLGLVWLTHRRLIADTPGDVSERRRAWWCLMGVSACVPAALGFELLQAGACGHDLAMQVLTGFEEAVEAAAVLLLTACNATLASAYRV